MSYYAVKKGRKTGIYPTWDECKKQTDGFSGAVFQKFSSYEDAEGFMKGITQKDNIEAEDNYCFVNGSYNVKTGYYGCGGFLVTDGEKILIKKADNNPVYADMRNVAGELLGVILAVKIALAKGMKELTVFYDYAGIENWATGSWKANKEATKEYRDFIEKMSTYIEIRFVKVKAHSNIEGNEQADRLAKSAVGI